MLVSHSKKFIYIKTIKTAGTSVEVAMQKYCLPPKGEIPPGTVGREAIETSYGIVGKRGECVEGYKWFNHMPASRIRDQLPAEIEELESAIAALQTRIARSDFYSQPSDDVQTVLLKLSAAEALLEKRVERWGELETRRDSLQST